jgi:hypothetical protein
LWKILSASLVGSCTYGCRLSMLWHEMSMHQSNSNIFTYLVGYLRKLTLSPKIWSGLMERWSMMNYNWLGGKLSWSDWGNTEIYVARLRESMKFLSSRSRLPDKVEPSAWEERYTCRDLFGVYMECISSRRSHNELTCPVKGLNTKFRGFSPQAKYTDRATTSCRRS